MDNQKGEGKLGTHVGNRYGQLMLGPAFNFVVQFPQRLQSCLKSQFNQSMRNGEGANSNTVLKIERELVLDSTWVPNLEKQLQAWRENPNWKNHPPEVKVTVPKGSLCNLSAKFKVGLPPDAIYNIVTDPDNRRVFKNIKRMSIFAVRALLFLEVISRKVLVDDGSRQVVEVEQAAIWRFLWWSGTISVHVFVDQNQKDHTVKFKQGKLGFMKRFEGCWRVEPLFVDGKSCSKQPRTLYEYDSCTGGKGRVASFVTLDQLVQPAIVPPPPISWYLRGITRRTTEMLIHDLLAEADRLRGIAVGADSSEEHETSCNQVDAVPANNLGEIKERWRQRRHMRRRQV